MAIRATYGFTLPLWREPLYCVDIIPIAYRPAERRPGVRPHAPDPLPQPRPVPNPHDLHGVRLDPIPDQIGRHCRKFPQPAGRSTSLGMFCQAFACQFQPLRHALRRQRSKLVDVPLDRGQIGQRPERPDYLNHDAGGGASSGVPQVSSQRATSSWGTTRPASMSARPSASAAASASSSTSSNRLGSGFTAGFYHILAERGTHRKAGHIPEPPIPAQFPVSSSSQFCPP